MGKIIETKLPHRSARFARYANRNQPIELIRALAAYDYKELYDVIVKALTESGAIHILKFNLIFSDGAITKQIAESMGVRFRQKFESIYKWLWKEFEAHIKTKSTYLFFKKQ